MTARLSALLAALALLASLLLLGSCEEWARAFDGPDHDSDSTYAPD
jgi:hypothetical protein